MTCPAITGVRVSVATLVHAFVTSLLFASTTVMYCWRAHQRLRLTKLQRLLNAADTTRKFDCGLRQLMHVDLQWLDVSQRVKFKLLSMVHNCVHHKVPRYLHSDLCDQSMTSSFCQASLPRCALTQSPLIWASGICCCRPNCLEWNSLSDDLHDPMLSTDSFRRTHSVLAVSHFMCYINSQLTNLLVLS